MVTAPARHADITNFTCSTQCTRSKLLSRPARDGAICDNWANARWHDGESLGVDIKHCQLQVFCSVSRLPSLQPFWLSSIVSHSGGSLQMTLFYSSTCGSRRQHVWLHGDRLNVEQIQKTGWPLLSLLQHRVHHIKIQEHIIICHEQHVDQQHRCVVVLYGMVFTELSPAVCRVQL